MSKRNKLKKFAELLTFPNVFENFTPDTPQLVGVNMQTVDLKGKWQQNYFKNDNPITLELACGGGEYTIGLAQRFPDRNFIGIDIKGARIWKGARVALREELSNVAFVRTRIEQIEHFFAPQEVKEIWITFPDPFLRNSKASRRLTAPGFLDRYRKIIHKDNLVHLKTDDPTLYEFTMETLQADEGVKILYYNDDIYQVPELYMEELTIKTHYERMHLAAQKTIKFVQWQMEL